jgi:serine/threonine protein kinase
MLGSQYITVLLPLLLQRDLKPQNLLLSDASRTPQLKIADFGFARDLQPQVCAPCRWPVPLSV